MPRPTPLTGLLVVCVLFTAACSGGDLCAQAPRCDDSEALNCETACAVGPCSTGPTVQDCGEGATCTVVPGNRTDSRFYGSRAVCALERTACNPADAPPPVCEGDRLVTGCSAYLRNIRVPCSQAGLYFTRVPACCLGGTGDGGMDAGTRDAGTGDGGIPDAGTPGADAGR
ncbi:hypothetical protein [Pyxidicoccus trucidator]|uniref:hypothetical protein n=1 Tax=Pyxidicoccus trucidator TaxID=2709662 RepID=UPI001F08594F|nr:hypothetical protein [Pyxidicoccus trucidator]